MNIIIKIINLILFLMLFFKFIKLLIYTNYFCTFKENIKNTFN